MKLSDCTTEADRRAWAEAHNATERARQGLPPKVEDPGTIERLARVFRLERHGVAA